MIETFINAKQKMNATIFMVTHDSFAASFCDRVILLKDGTFTARWRNGKTAVYFRISFWMRSSK